MISYRISEIATLLEVSDDTVRRWIDEKLLDCDSQAKGPLRVTGQSVVTFLHEHADQQYINLHKTTHSPRNQLAGIIVNIVSDKVMSQVEMQCGRYRIVSLISTEAVRDLDLQVGKLAIAQVKATNVSIIGN